MLYLMKKVGLDIFKDSPLVKVQQVHPVIKSEIIGLVVVHVMHILHSQLGLT